MTIDDVATTITEGVVNVPYTAAKVVVSGTAATVHGTETIEDEYTIDVDYEALRVKVSDDAIIVDQNAHTISGVITKPVIACDIYKNGARATWTQKSRYTYRVKINNEWSEYYDISYNHSGATIGILAGVPTQLQIKYVYSGTTIESEPIDIDVSADFVADEKIIITTETEGITIDNENRTITGTVAADAEIAFRAAYTDAEITTGNVYIFYSDKWLYTLTAAAHTGAEVATATYSVPMVKLTADDPAIYGETYTVTITTS